MVDEHDESIESEIAETLECAYQARKEAAEIRAQIDSERAQREQQKPCIPSAPPYTGYRIVRGEPRLSSYAVFADWMRERFR